MALERKRSGPRPLPVIPTLPFRCHRGHLGPCYDIQRRGLQARPHGLIFYDDQSMISRHRLDLLLDGSLLAECSEWSNTGPSTSHDNGDLGVTWWMEGLLRWANSSSDPHSRLQVGEEVCRSSQVHPFLGYMLRFQDCDRKGNLERIL